MAAAVSQIRCVSVTDAGGNVHTTLSVPREVLDRVNSFEDVYGEQEGAVRRDRLLSALAAMVIQSLDEFRTTDIFKTPPRHIPPGTAAGTINEGEINDDKG